MFSFDPSGYDGTLLKNIWENDEDTCYSYLNHDFSQPSHDLKIKSIVKSSHYSYSNQLLVTNFNHNIFIFVIISMSRLDRPK